MKNEYYRREFIKKSALAGIGLSVSGSAFSIHKQKGNTVNGRIGIIGLDTSHVIAFTKSINSEPQRTEFAGFRVAAAYPTKGSADMPSSINRLEGYTNEIQKLGVEIVDSIEELVQKVDYVLLESLDGRRHLEESIPVFKAGKRVFIDKPLSNSLEGAIAIFEAAKKYNVPFFSSSSLRFTPATREISKGIRENVGKVLCASTYSNATRSVEHMDMANYGIHGIESLFTLMGTGCREVTRFHSPIADTIVGTWDDGRIGVFNAVPKGGKGGFGGRVYGEKGVEDNLQIFVGYEPMLVQIIEFFRTGNVPVSMEETLEVFAFMEAADVSKQKGRAITLGSVMQDATKKAEGLLKKYDI